MTRRINLREAYRGFRNRGADVVSAAFVALVWVIAGVEVEES